MRHQMAVYRWVAVCIAMTLCQRVSEPVMAAEPGLKNLRCVNVEVTVEQDPGVQSRFDLTEEDLRGAAAKTLKSALPLLMISHQCGNRLRVLLVLHDVPSERMQAYQGLLITGIERIATLAETGDRQDVEVWSGGIQEFRGPVERATTTTHRALAQSLDHFTEAYLRSGNP